MPSTGPSLSGRDGSSQRKLSQGGEGRPAQVTSGVLVVCVGRGRGNLSTDRTGDASRFSGLSPFPISSKSFPISSKELSAAQEPLNVTDFDRLFFSVTGFCETLCEIFSHTF